MNPILFYDTETTGVPLFKEPSEHPDQPHIVQLAAIVVDPVTRKTIGAMDVIVRPDGWAIPNDVAALHGITTEHAAAVGIPEPEALEMFMQPWDVQGRVRIAHNEQFDARIIRIALKRFMDAGEEVPISDAWKACPAECTARMATPICKLPPTEKMRAVGRHHPKTPNLGEAYRHFFGRDFENAHTAMADVLACRDIYFHMKDLKEAA